MYSEYLAFLGYRVEAADHGVEALARSTALKPALVVMDLSMPEMDGWEATRRLKANPATNGIPVLVLTGHALAGAEESARAAGADAFLTKPCLPESLAEKIAEMLAE
jgi:two-component system, cell cycle response regulator DivK